MDELERTVTLLLFEDPATAPGAEPLRDLLHPSARAVAAQELNAALLNSWGLPSGALALGGAARRRRSTDAPLFAAVAQRLACCRYCGCYF